jgi:hypothetical protein
MQIFRRVRSLALAASFPATLAPTALAEPSASADASPPPADFTAARALPQTSSAPPPAAPDATPAPPTLFGDGVAVGAYAGIDTSYARLFHRSGALIGLGGAILIDHRLSLGAAWYGSTNPLLAPDAANGDGQHYLVEYGGINVHYSVFFERSPVYLSVGALVGGGAIELSRDRDHGPFSDYGDVSRHDGFAIFQPELSANANLTHWMRIGIGAGYRLTSGVNRNGFGNADLNGFMLGGQLQFGSF